MILLLGDSISVRYAPFLRAYLHETAHLVQKEGRGRAEDNLDIPAGSNGGDSRMVLTYLRSRLTDTASLPDILLLNCGLHDIKRRLPGERLDIEIGEYTHNLESLFTTARAHGICPIWVSSTPVVDAIHNEAPLGFRRYSADLITYNAAAAALCERETVPVIDLHSFSRALGTSHLIDHVHYDEEARRLQAAYIAGALGQILAGDAGAGAGAGAGDHPTR